MKPKYKLDAEEQEILKALESKKLKPLKNSKVEIKKLKAAAKAYGNRDHRIHIRLNDHDYERVQEKALREGIPYATMISSIVHKYFTGQLIENKS